MTTQLLITTYGQKVLSTGRVVLFLTPNKGEDNIVIFPSEGWVTAAIGAAEKLLTASPGQLSTAELSELREADPTDLVLKEPGGTEDEVEAVEHVLESLNLRAPSAAPDMVLIGDDAGIDGNALTKDIVRDLVKLWRSKKYQPAIVERLARAPMADLKKFQTVIPRRLRHAITEVKARGLPVGAHGGGAGFIPAELAGFMNSELGNELSDLSARGGMDRESRKGNIVPSTIESPAAPEVHIQAPEVKVTTSADIMALATRLGFLKTPAPASRTR